MRATKRKLLAVTIAAAALLTMTSANAWWGPGGPIAWGWDPHEAYLEEYGFFDRLESGRLCAPSSSRSLSPTDSWLPVCNWLRSTEATFALRGAVSFSAGSVVPRNSPRAKRCSGSHFLSTPRVLIARRHALLNGKVCDPLSGPHRPAREHGRRMPFSPILFSTGGRRSWVEPN
jgi:hypothetical protein